MSGPSRYDAIVREMVRQLDADAVVLVVVGGVRGNGACPALRLSGDPARDAQLKDVVVYALRAMADGLEQGIEPGRVAPEGDVS